MNLSINSISSNKNQSFGSIRRLDLKGLGDKHNAIEVVTNFVTSKPVRNYANTHDLFISTISGRVVIADPRRKAPLIHQFEEKTYTANVDKETSRLVAEFQEWFPVKTKTKKK